MFLSVFDLFKIGIGPSSSHTVGPMIAAGRFLETLRSQRPRHMKGLRVVLRGSLAFTGKGHGTDRAVALGLLGHLPGTIDFGMADADLAAMHASRRLQPLGLPELAFDPHADVVFDYGPPLPGHANGMIFEALDDIGEVVKREIYYSTGGGFVVGADEQRAAGANHAANCPYPFTSATEMLAMAEASELTIAAMMLANEETFRPREDVSRGIVHLWEVMAACIERGLAVDGELPGGLKVRRRASRIYRQLVAERGSETAQPHVAAEWLSVYAMAVNEENAAGGRVVTAPTNGAAGVVPAVLSYYLNHCVGADPDRLAEFLLTAAAIGGIIKRNASISGAEVGCQGEVGSAAAMAAAGLCAVLGGSPRQIECAAEIALEHHLGMTCDPAAGLVQVPCIERNGVGANKAVVAASLALRGDGQHFMPLDNCIEAMRQTGCEMNSKYKETSLGGLAANLPEC